MSDFQYVLANRTYDFDFNLGMDNLISAFNKTECRRGEIPSVNVHASARGLAKLAACMVAKGSIDGVSIMSEETADKMHDKYTKAAFHDLAWQMEFSQGGVALFR